MAGLSPLELERVHLLETLEREGITDPRVLGAMADIRRELFVPTSLWERAYENSALPIDHSQSISQPYIVGIMTQALGLHGPEKVLEIGTGTGYQTAILSRLCREVFTIERIQELCWSARQRLQQMGVTNVRYRVGDGSRGWSAVAPFDAITVTAASPEVPQSLVDQLVDGGRLVIPVGGSQSQRLKLFIKEGNRVEDLVLCQCRFVPLVGLEGWPEGESAGAAGDGSSP